jgi:hypothetical protein
LVARNGSARSLFFQCQVIEALLMLSLVSTSERIQ